jgi:uncharacterized membrane protein
MIELLVMIGVIGWFSRTAYYKSKNRLSPVLWGIIGAVSYYGPVLLMGYVIQPALLMDFYRSIGNQAGIIFISVVINLITGIVCCGAAALILINLKEDIKPQNIVERKCPYCGFGPLTSMDKKCSKCFGDL